MNELRNKLAIALLLSTAGCATNQDVGIPGTTLKGIAIDGAITLAQVYIDTNNNNKLDDWEPHALTDDKGYFSYNPSTGIDYCRDGAPLTDSIHCLKTMSTESMALLRFSGGYDLTTSTKFHGAISANVSIAAASAGTGVVTNPVTTLLSYMTSAQKTAFLANESAALSAVVAGTTLTEADLATDYTDYTGITNATAKQIWVAKLAMEVHKVVDVIEAGLVENTISDARAKTYKALAAATYTTTGFGAYLLANMPALVDAAAGVSTAAWTAPTATDIANRALEVANLAQSIFVASNPAMTTVEMKGRLRAVEILASGMRDFVTAGNTAAITPGSVAASTAATNVTDGAQYLTSLGTSFVFNLVKAKFFPLATAPAWPGATTGLAGIAPSNVLATSAVAGSKLAISSGTDGASLSFSANNTLSLNIAVSGGTTSPLGGSNVINGTYTTLADGTLIMNLEPLPGVIVPAVVNVVLDPATSNYTYTIDFNGTTTMFPVPGGSTGFCTGTQTSTTAGTC